MIAPLAEPEGLTALKIEDVMFKAVDQVHTHSLSHTHTRSAPSQSITIHVCVTSGVWLSRTQCIRVSASVLRRPHRQHEQDGHRHAGGRVRRREAAAPGTHTHTHTLTPINSQSHDAAGLTRVLCVVCAASAGGDPRRCRQSRDDRRRRSGKQAGGPRDGHQRAEEIPQDQGQNTVLIQDIINKYMCLIFKTWC